MTTDVIVSNRASNESFAGEGTLKPHLSMARTICDDVWLNLSWFVGSGG